MYESATQAPPAATAPRAGTRVYRDIAVALTGIAGDTAAFDAAAELARPFDSRLELLQLVMMPTPFVDAWSLVPDAGFYQAYDDMRQYARKENERWRDTLATRRVAGDVKLLEALYVEPASLAARAARNADLVVIARPYREPVDTAVVHTYFGGLLTESGRPVLVVPSASPVSLPARHAVIAWTDEPEAARAVHDAMPLLRLCRTVDVVVVRKDPSVGWSGPRLEPLCAHLARHGVSARGLVVDPGKNTIASTLVTHALRTHAQLIVAGGYGHARMREWAFGGVTRELFLDCPLPVLFSH